MSGWKIVKEQGETPYSYIHNNSGEFTVGESLCGGVPDDCTAFTEYSVTAKIEEDTTNFDEFVQKCGDISKTLNGISCNQDALVMWFNYGDNKSYTDILDNNSAFYIKNVDECRHIIISHDLRVGGQEFNKKTYEDSGFPKIVVTDYLIGKSSMTPKYSAETSYNGHKIKYAVSGDTIPTNTLIDNNELVELYFPRYSVSGDNVTEVKNIAEGAFSGNTRLSAVTFNQIETISANAFTKCSALEHIDWRHSFCPSFSIVKTIGREAFKECYKLNYVNLPPILKEIGAYAFEETMQNTENSCLYIPTSLDVIKMYAFREINPKCIVWKITDDGLLKDGLLSKNDSSDYNPVFSFKSSPIYVYLPNLTTESSFETVNEIISGLFPSGSKIYVGMSDADISKLSSGEHYFSSDTTVLNKSHWTEDGFSESWPYDNPS